MNLKYLFIAAMVAITLKVQSQSYSFSVSTSTYSDLSGSTSLNDTMTWDDPEYAVPIGFDFDFFHLTFDEIFFDDWGLGGVLSTDTTDSGVRAILIPYGADIIDRGYDFVADSITTGSLSNISYLLEGSTGSRIFKIEWKNVGFYSELQGDGISTDYVNFQLWLYEGSNAIEIHFGPDSISQPDTSFEGESGPLVGLYPKYDMDNDSFIASGIALTGNADSPNAVVADSAYGFYLNGNPSNGTVFRFSRNTTAMRAVDNKVIDFTIYPSPAHDYIQILSDDMKGIEEITIMNMTGKTVRRLNNFTQRIDISTLKPGVYLIHIVTEEGTAIKRFIKG